MFLFCDLPVEEPSSELVSELDLELKLELVWKLIYSKDLAELNLPAEAS